MGRRVKQLIDEQQQDVDDDNDDDDVGDDDQTRQVKQPLIQAVVPCCPVATNK